MPTFRRKSRRWTVPVKAAAILVLSLLLVSCLGWFLKEPEIAVNKIVVNPRSLTEMSMTFGLEVRNPNSFDLTLRSFTYTITVNGEELGSGRLEKEILLPASAVAQVEAPVAATFRNPGGSLVALITARDLPYKMEGRVNVSAFFGSHEFVVRKEGRIDWKK